MDHFTITHEFNCSVETFWSKLMFDTALNEAMYRQAMHFPEYELLEQRETENEVFRTIACMPKMDLPGPVAKVLGDRFRYVEETRYDKTTQTAHFKTSPPQGCASSQGGQITNEGNVHVEAINGSKCRRIIDLAVEAKIPVVGGLIERAAKNEIRKGYDAGAIFINDWIAERKLNA